MNVWTKFLSGLRQTHNPNPSRLPQYDDFDRSRCWEVVNNGRVPSLYIRFFNPMECNICQNSLFPEEGENTPLTVLDCYLNRCSGSIYHEACLTSFLTQQTRSNSNYFCPVCRHDVTSTAQDSLVFTARHTAPIPDSPQPAANPPLRIPVRAPPPEENDGVEVQVPIIVNLCRGKIVLIGLCVTSFTIVIAWALAMTVIATQS